MKTALSVIGCLLVYLLIPIFGYLFGISIQHVWREPAEYLYFGSSAALSYALMMKYGGGRLRFAQTFTHELIHSLFVVLSFGTVQEFHVNTHTGYILSDKDNLAVKLSPYFFPIYTLMLMAIRPGIQEIYHPLFDVIAGGTFAFYINMVKNQRGLWQSDIQSVGWYLSYPFMICMELLFCYLIIESMHTNLWVACLQLVKFVGRLIANLF